MQLKVVKATNVRVFHDPVSLMSPVFLTQFKQTCEVIHLFGQPEPQKFKPGQNAAEA